MQTGTYYNPATLHLHIGEPGSERDVADVANLAQALDTAEQIGGRLPWGSHWPWDEQERVFRLHLPDQDATLATEQERRRLTRAYRSACARAGRLREQRNGFAGVIAELYALLDRLEESGQDYDIELLRGALPERAVVDATLGGIGRAEHTDTPAEQSAGQPPLFEVAVWGAPQEGHGLAVTYRDNTLVSLWSREDDSLGVQIDTPDDAPRNDDGPMGVVEVTLDHQELYSNPLPTVAVVRGDGGEGASVV